MKTLIKLHQQDGDWYCYVSQESNVILPAIPELFKQIEDFPETLKDDRRSLVKLGKLGDLKVVAKQPRDKNRRKWIRILSLLGPAEARKTFTTLLEFQTKGIESLAPVCLLERRSCGMVVDSWLLYEYREGFKSDSSHLPRIAELLKLLHSHGYRHEDPNYDNFLIGPDGQMFLIDCKGKSRVGRYSDYYDFMLLGSGNLSEKEIAELTDVDKFSLGYWQARAYRGYIKLRSVWKEKIGRRRSKQERD